MQRLKAALQGLLERRGRTLVHVDAGTDTGQVTSGIGDEVAAVAAIDEETLAAT